MVALDPFSAASKPMPDWDTIPSRPLPFAATLHTSTSQADATTSSHKLPRPIRTTDVPAQPPARKHRQASLSSSFSLLWSQSPRGAEVESDEWMQEKVARCVDNAQTDLNISDFGLERMSTKIADLQNLVTLSSLHSPTGSPSATRSPRAFSPPASPWHETLPRLSSPRHLRPLGDRVFSRTQSAPASAAFFASLGRGSTTPAPGGGLLPSPDLSDKSLARDTDPSDAATPNVTGHRDRRTLHRARGSNVNQSRSKPNVAIYASQNRLTSLPTALFEITNLTVLTLRNNQLQSLPPAIGELVHLRELSISNNKIPFLPSTIMKLRNLEQFSAHPNPWLEPNLDTASGPRSLSPLVCHSPETVPRLSALCLTVLLSPRGKTGRPPFVNYDWDDCRVENRHPLLDPEALHQIMPPSLQLEELKSILRAVESGCKAVAQKHHRRGQHPQYQFEGVEGFPATHAIPQPDDASFNPYYSPCPSPRHDAYDIGGEPLQRRLYLHPSEERFEWREVGKVPQLPIQWLGCSPGCLAFLEQAEEEEEDWPVDDGAWGDIN